VKAEQADTLTAWRPGLFCAIGDVNLDGFCAAVTEQHADALAPVAQRHDRLALDAGQAPPKRRRRLDVGHREDPH
jgi:hypothetical protein